jgi:hypothetical protein
MMKSKMWTSTPLMVFLCIYFVFFFLFIFFKYDDGPDQASSFNLARHILHTAYKNTIVGWNFNIIN